MRILGDVAASAARAEDVEVIQPAAPTQAVHPAARKRRRFKLQQAHPVTTSIVFIGSLPECFPDKYKSVQPV